MRADRDRPGAQRGGHDRRRDRRDPRVRPGARDRRRSTTARTTARRRSRARAGAHVLRLPFNLGIGGAVQTGFRYAFENGFDLAVRVDGDGQHDPSQLAAVVEPVAPRRGRHRRRLALPRRTRRRLPLVCDAAHRHPPPRARRLAAHATADHGPDVRLPGAEPQGDHALRRRLPARLPRGRGDRARRAPPPAAASRCRSRCARGRPGSRRSGPLSSVYYMVKVLLALFVGSFRRNSTPLEEK